MWSRISEEGSCACGGSSAPNETVSDLGIPHDACAPVRDGVGLAGVDSDMLELLSVPYDTLADPGPVAILWISPEAFQAGMQYRLSPCHRDPVAHLH